ncbi:hypothetical protein BDA96_01G105500 [Sorghum bicolor]|jgi:hypothetical protein|uniref:Uncharacterized protein n=2 Tax=Sorghum bicolor TaxID=4558 RepID=A0A921RYW6_SORBI|nr:hypothetical protein BDA96_01G105500 [Sorghum bicolor]KXG37633.1 hypothetical protein SORBI_3001G101600 [Sorghum bicolor]
MAVGQMLGPCVKLLIVLALVMSASDGAGASRPLVTAAAGQHQQQSTNGYGGVLASVKLAVVMRRLWAGPSGCTYDPNSAGRRCP